MTFHLFSSTSPHIGKVARCYCGKNSAHGVSEEKKGFIMYSMFSWIYIIYTAVLVFLKITLVFHSGLKWGSGGGYPKSGPKLNFNGSGAS